MTLNEVMDCFVEAAVRRGASIGPIEQAPWIDELEGRLGFRLPTPYRALVTRYQFAPFEIGGLDFFANTGVNDLDELAVAVFRDRFISTVTLAHGFLQVARPADGNYDPICFDLNHRSQNRDCPIVRLDHEAILISDRIRKIRTIAPSFFQFVIGVINGRG